MHSLTRALGLRNSPHQLPWRPALLRTLAFVGILAMGGWPIAGAAAPAAQPGSLKVLATTTQIQDFVRNVGGDRTEGLLFGAARVTIVPMLNGDDDAHEYQPTAEDARNVADADLI